MARDHDVVHLEDLAPRKSVVGGSGKLLFGERLDPTAGDRSSEEPETRDRRH
jgi:hypothetical protein